MVSSIQAIDRTGAVSEGIATTALAPLQHAPGDGWRTQASVFEEIFLVFLVLGTIVGVVVITYSLYNAIKYRDDGSGADDVDRPQVGELPGGGSGGKKLFLSFAISAIIVVGLIAWTYGALLYVEAGPADVDENLDVEVVAIQFGWEFHYENGHMEMNTLYVPVDQMVSLDVTSRDVWHTFGAPELRIKADAIPGQTSGTWFVADEVGTYDAWCFELCGVGHSAMTADIVVMEQDEFDEWYEDVGSDADEGNETEENEGSNADDGDENTQSVAVNP